MPDEIRSEGAELPYRVVLLSCRRTGQAISPEEHARCPYCFGREADVRSGVHGRFCDYHPEKDPIRFGMPEWSTRQRSG